jgi:acyl-CoA synthetase (NDP forming)
MSTYRLKNLLGPRSVALVGASPRQGSVGGSILRNIRDAKFKGEFGLVNTHYAEIDGVATVGSLSQLLRNHFDRRPARRRDIADLLDYFALDGRTRAILLYVEAIKDARKFMSAARAAARIKPVVIVKSGRMALGAKAAMRLHCASGMP